MFAIFASSISVGVAAPVRNFNQSTVKVVVDPQSFLQCYIALTNFVAGTRPLIAVSRPMCDWACPHAFSLDTAGESYPLSGLP